MHSCIHFYYLVSNNPNLSKFNSINSFFFFHSFNVNSILALMAAFSGGLNLMEANTHNFGILFQMLSSRIFDEQTVILEGCCVWFISTNLLVLNCCVVNLLTFGF